MKYIENDSLKVMFNNEGTITSIFDKVNDSELVHQVDEEGWKFQDVTIFPLIGSYDYEVDGVNYHISSRHGFVRNRALVLHSLENQVFLSKFISLKSVS